jgi:IclR family mhp operon transcriptional activator
MERTDLPVDARPVEAIDPDPWSAADPAPAPRAKPAGAPRQAGRCRTNSRRGHSDPGQTSYPPVESVRRALEILRVVNRLRIASVTEIHADTRLPKPTIVRMLETLMVNGYVERDNMFGGYRVTCRTRELNAGYDGISMVIEGSRALAIELTQLIKWPIGIGTLDGDAIAIQFWTGSISPWAHTSTVLGLRPSLLTSAMGRVYVAFCPEDERERLIETMRVNLGAEFGPKKESEYRQLLVRLRAEGYAVRDPRTEPKQTTTLAMPLCLGSRVLAAISISFYRSAIPLQDVATRIIEPLRATKLRIEDNLSLLMRDASGQDVRKVSHGFGSEPLTPT